MKRSQAAALIDLLREMAGNNELAEARERVRKAVKVA